MIGFNLIIQYITRKWPEDSNVQPRLIILPPFFYDVFVFFISVALKHSI